MLKDAVAVIDVGTSKITGLIGENGVNNNFIIRAHSERTSYCIDAGTICDPTRLKQDVEAVFADVESSARAKIVKVYFSVPSDFLVVRNCSQQTYLNRVRRLRKKDVEEYLLASKKTLAVPGYELIDHSGVQYYLDGQKKVTTLSGNVTSSINGITSFYFAKSAFTNAVRDILTPLGVKEIAFVPVPIAEALLLFTEKERYAFQVLIDVGMSTTGFSIIYGGGVLYNKAFDIGGGCINAYLMQKLNVKSFELTEKIKRKFNLTVPSDFEGYYEVSDGDRIYRFSQRACNEVAEYFLTELADKIDEALKESNVRLPNDFTLSLTGGGIAYMRGAKEFLFGAVEIPINVVCPKVLYMAKPEETSKMAVLNYALNRVEL